MKINTYARMGSPTVKSTISILDWLELIKKSIYSEQIEEFQKLNLSKSDKRWDEFKNSLPCCTYNFLFDKYKKNENIISSTKFLFIDIDNEDDLDGLDLNYIFAQYKSVSGRGWHIIVKVEGITLDNFSNFYLNVIRDLGLSSKYDKNAKKATQYTILSSDPNIYINDNSFVFKYSFEEEGGGLSKVELNNIKEIRLNTEVYNSLPPAENNILIKNQKRKIKLSNKNKFLKQEDKLYSVYPEGQNVIELNIYPYTNLKKKIKNGFRNMILSTMAKKIMLINNFLELNTLINYIKSINKNYCVEPISDEEVIQICNYSFKNYEKYKDVLQTKKKIIFHPEHGLPNEEILKIVQKVMAKIKSENVLKALKENYKENISPSELSKLSNVSLPTVKKYWKEISGEEIINKKEVVKQNKREIIIQAIQKLLSENKNVTQTSIVKITGIDAKTIKKHLKQINMENLAGNNENLKENVSNNITPSNEQKVSENGCNEQIQFIGDFSDLCDDNFEGENDFGKGNTVNESENIEKIYDLSEEIPEKKVIIKNEYPTFQWFNGRIIETYL